MGASQVTGKTVTTNRTSDGGASSSIGILNKNMPMSDRASDQIRPANSQIQDGIGGGFFVHKRGGDALPILAVNKRNSLIEHPQKHEMTSLGRKKQVRTMEQQAREGAAKTIASGRVSESEDQNDTSIALSNRDSLNNFSYYGRRGVRDSSPNASDAMSLHYNRSAQKNLNVQLPSAFASNQHLDSINESGKKVKMIRKGSQGLKPRAGTIMTEGNLENVSNSVAGIYGRKSSSINPIGYILEEKMNDDLMKVFQPMLSTDRDLKQQRLSTQDAMNINSVSDFSIQLGDSSLGGPYSGQNKMQISQQRLPSRGQGLPSVMKSVSLRNNTEGIKQRPQAGSTLAVSTKAHNIMLKNSLNSLPLKNLTTTAKVLPPRLPPRVTLSPAINKNAKANFQQKTETPLKNRIVKLQPQPQTERVQKAGAIIRKDKRLILDAPLKENLLTGPQSDTQSRNLKQSDSVGSIHSTARAEANIRKCGPCLDKKGGCEDHKSEIAQRIQHFNKNFMSSGRCRVHNQPTCDLCSYCGSSKGSRLSSHGSPTAFRSRSVLKQDRLVVLKSEMSQKKAKNANKSVTRQLQTSVKKKESSPSGLMPREQSSFSTLKPSGNQSSKKANLMGLRGALHAFSKVGNRPNISTLQMPDDRSLSNSRKNLAVSEFPINRKSPVKKNAIVSSIPNFARALSAKDNVLKRDDISRRLMQNQNDHENLLQTDVRTLAQEWEGDPQHPEFWNRIENQNDQMQKRQRSLVNGEDIRAKQKDLLMRQSSVFDQLRETDEQFYSERNQTARNSSLGNNPHNKNSFNQMEEPIQTEIDQHDMTLMGNANNPFQVAGSKRMLHEPSKAGLTDYDIADEVTQKFGASQRQHQLELHDRTIKDQFGEDNNIEDLKRQLERQINESKAPRTITGTQEESRMDASRFTGTFAAASDIGGIDLQRPSPQAKGAKQVPVAKQARPRKNEQVEAKDSEEAESFAEEKQKTQILKELALGDQNKSEDENAKVKKAIHKKTMAMVKDYDEYLEAQPQKEDDGLNKERASRLGQISPKDTINIPEDGVLKIPTDERQRNSMTQKLNTSSKIEKPDTVAEKEASLAETILEQQEMTQARRPKTRGDPATEGLGPADSNNKALHGEELQKDENKKENDAFSASNKSKEKPNSHQRNNTLSGRRMTQDQLSGTGKNSDANSRNEKSKSEMRFMGAAAPVPLGAGATVPSEKNFRSNAQMTALESSFKDDDLMISASQVDPLEASRKFNKGNKMPFSTQDIIGDLVIKEEGEISPLTDASRSKKSSMYNTQEPAPTQPAPENIINSATPKQPTSKKGLPPKSPMQNNAKKPPKPQLQEQQKDVLALGQASRPSRAQAQPLATIQTASVDEYSEIRSPNVAGGERNQAVLDFLAYEDSDEDLGKVVASQPEEAPLPAPQMENMLIQPELGSESPERKSSKKTPSNQKFVPDDSFIKSNPTANMDAMRKSLVEPKRGPGKTPKAKKRSALHMAPIPDRQTETPVPEMPQTAGGVSEDVSEYINKIPYDQSNEGMSASYYRQHDQWLASQPAAAPTGSVTTRRKSTPRLPPVQENTRYHQLPPPSREAKTTGRRRENQEAKAAELDLPPLQESQQDNDPSRKTTSKFLPRSSSIGRGEKSRQSVPMIQRQRSVLRQDAFFEKHKPELDEKINKNALKRKETSIERAASTNRLYGQETIASILKRNSELGFEPAKKKPPVMPLRRLPTKKKVRKPRAPSESSEDPPEEPLPQSPRGLQFPIEASVPHQEGAPTTMPLPCRLPEDPPSEPSTFVMANIYCPLDPDTPYCYDPEPREEDTNLNSPPLEPFIMHKPLEPENIYAHPEAPSMRIEEMMSEKLDEQESVTIGRAKEPSHDDEPILTYPRQERPMVLPSSQPSKFEPPTGMPAEEPDLDPGSTDHMPLVTDPELQMLPQGGKPKKVHEMSIQCSNVEEEVKGELTRRELDGMQSDEDIFSMHSFSGTINRKTVGIQTNANHFRKIELSPEFQKQQQERAESTDWAFSPIYDDIHFAKDKRAGRRALTSMATQTQNCGNQVSEKQIEEDVEQSKLSQIECEYNVDQLKRKLAGKDEIKEERLCKLYTEGLKTLKFLMIELKLEKEWREQTSQQYLPPDESTDFTNVDETIKLLIRNKKMYEAKTLIQRLLKMIVERDSLVEQAQKYEDGGKQHVVAVSGEITGNIQLNANQKPQISRDFIVQIKRLSTRIASQINTLQEEHRIFRRPFILYGTEYLEQMIKESVKLDNLLPQNSNEAAVGEEK